MCCHFDKFGRNSISIKRNQSLSQSRTYSINFTPQFFMCKEEGSEFWVKFRIEAENIKDSCLGPPYIFFFPHGRTHEVCIPNCYIASFFLNLCLGTKIEGVRREFEMLYQRHSDLGTRMLKIEKSSFHLVPNHEPLNWLIKKNLNTYLTSDCAKWTRYGDILSRFSACIKNKSKCLNS
jgi:hypothetical protein